MFSQAFIKNSVHGGVSQHAMGGGGVSQHAIGRGCLPRGCLPRGVCPGCLPRDRFPWDPEGDTPQLTIKAGDTHHTGTHSCFGVQSTTKKVKFKKLQILQPTAIRTS